MTAPAAIASDAPMTRAMPMNATPRVAAVVHELPVTIPISPVNSAAAK